MASPEHPAPRRAEVIGTGLIGGSIGLGLRAQGWHVTGSDADPAVAGEAANMAKYAAAEAALGALDQAMQTHGGNGLSSEFGLADMWGMTRLMRTAPVSREMILNFVAQHSLQLPKSY